VGVSKVVILGPNSDQSPGGCLGGSIMLVESRRVLERRLRPQAGCHVQRPQSTPGMPLRRFSCTVEAEIKRHPLPDHRYKFWLGRSTGRRYPE
jgi:hypothetical protein